MKKFINNLQVITLILIIPATMLAYLNTSKKEEVNSEKSSIVRKTSIPVTEAARVFHMIKSF